MSVEDRQTFDRWLKSNALVGAMFVVGLITMSFSGSQQGTPPDGALAGGDRPAMVVAAVTPK
jgi:hypothetical protein